MLEDLSIAARRADVISRIAVAAKGAGRMPEDISLIAVSKVQPEVRVAEMLEAGQTVFGENRVQEAQSRWGETFADKRETLELRLIGPLQSNKAEAAAELFDVIETLDREKLAKALIKAAQKIGRMPEVLVQVNTGEEEQKAGVHPQNLEAFLKTLRRDYDIHPSGLMCIPPQEEAASPHFWLLENLAKDNGLKVLSMGMSGDYETAIKMGATHVRVGSALFGEREA